MRPCLNLGSPCGLDRGRVFVVRAFETREEFSRNVSALIDRQGQRVAKYLSRSRSHVEILDPSARVDNLSGVMGEAPQARDSSTGAGRGKQFASGIKSGRAVTRCAFFLRHGANAKPPLGIF